jgi:hypothetical protein
MFKIINKAIKDILYGLFIIFSMLTVFVLFVGLIMTISIFPWVFGPILLLAFAWLIGSQERYDDDWRD